MFQGRKRTLATQRMLGPAAEEFSADGRAPALLALHGFTGTPSELRPMIDRVADAGYAVDAPFMPGHGDRVDALQELGFDAWVDAMRARAAALVERSGRVVVCGFSMGSLVAMELASERPEGLAGLVVLGNALTLTAPSSVPFSAFERFKWKVPDLYFKKLVACDITDREAAKAIATYDRHPLRAAYEVYLAGKRVAARVGSIECPALILHGRRDRVCSAKNAELLARTIGSKDVAVRVYERSAHVVAADVDRDEVAREVIAFLGRV